VTVNGGITRGGPDDGAGRISWGLAAVIALVLLAAGGFVVTRLIGLDRPSEPGAAPTPAATSASPSPTPTPTPEPGADIKGPLNLLLVGVDTRVSDPGWEPHADAVLIMHITAALDRAYLFSLPRDLIVDIPPFEKANFRGDRSKLTHAMSYGSRRPGRTGRPSAEQGLQLLSATVRDYTGIERFDAAAVLTFGAFDDLVDALGGVDLYIDQRVVSQHRRPDGRHRAPGNGGYVGPQMVYEKGMRHLNGWQALDYARQRYIAGGDYSRQRHQQQLIKALVGKIVDQDMARDPDRIDAVLRAMGDAMIFEGGDQQVIDFAFALSGLRPENITLVSLPGSSVTSGGSYRGERLHQIATPFLKAVREDTVDAFLADNPDLVVPDRG